MATAFGSPPPIGRVNTSVSVASATVDRPTSTSIGLFDSLLCHSPPWTGTGQREAAGGGTDVGPILETSDCDFLNCTKLMGSSSTNLMTYAFPLPSAAIP